MPHLLILFGLLFISAFFSSSETAFLSIQRVRLEHLVREGVPGAARVSRLLTRPHSLLSAILLGNNLTNTAAAAVGTVIAGQVVAGGEGEAVVVATLAVTVLLVLFGEVAPKALALSYSFNISRIWAFPMMVWTRLARPAVWALDHMTRAMLRVLGGEGALEPSVLGTAELRTAILLGAEAGALARLESSRLLGALTLEQRQVQEIMTPRVDVVAVDSEEPLRAVASRLAESGFLRLPVYEDNPDNVIGYVHVSDVSSALLRGLDRRARAIMRPITFESEHSSIAHVLELMKDRGSYLVMLVDEFGTTSGLVTFEDIVEEVVGNLRSESGEEAEEAIEAAGGRIEVEGNRLLVDLSNEIGSDFTDVEANTVAGLILAYLHRFPEPGEFVEHAGYRFTVLEFDERRITRVAVEPAASAASMGPLA